MTQSADIVRVVVGDLGGSELHQGHTIGQFLVGQHEVDPGEEVEVVQGVALGVEHVVGDVDEPGHLVIQLELDHISVDGRVGCGSDLDAQLGCGRAQALLDSRHPLFRGHPAACAGHLRPCAGR